MKYEDWLPLYREILKEFGYDESRDREAAVLAHKLSMEANKITSEELRKIIEGKEIVICGAAIRKEDIEKIEGDIIIAADETTSFLIKHEIFPHIITTDLDGNMQDIIKAGEKAVVIIHAHGDNMELLKKWIKRMNGKIMITTQSKPFKDVENFGGFTDGDRAYCIARHFGAKKIKLVGFDFSNPVEKAGKRKDIKKKKLKWAKRIIESC